MSDLGAFEKVMQEKRGVHEVLLPDGSIKLIFRAWRFVPSLDRLLLAGGLAFLLSPLFCILLMLPLVALETVVNILNKGAINPNSLWLRDFSALLDMVGMAIFTIASFPLFYNRRQTMILKKAEGFTIGSIRQPISVVSHFGLTSLQVRAGLVFSQIIGEGTFVHLTTLEGEKIRLTGYMNKVRANEVLAVICRELVPLGAKASHLAHEPFGQPTQIQL